MIGDSGSMSNDTIIQALQASDPTVALSDEELTAQFPEDRFWERMAIEGGLNGSPRDRKARRTLALGPRRPPLRGFLISAAVAALTASTAVAVSAALNSGVQAPKAVPKGSRTVITSGPQAYPASACDSSNPTSMLLPAAMIPNMVEGTSALAMGGQSLDLFGIPMPGVTTPPSLMSAAVVTGHLFDSRAPGSAIQNSDPYNVTHPHVVTTIDEGITGFTNASAESLFYSRAIQLQAPQANVSGQPQSEQLDVQRNVAGLPTPNVVTTTSLPGTDVPATIEVTIEAGHTVLGLSFEGGNSLSLPDVLQYADSAVNQVRITCGSLDIMDPSR
jgi:disulfide bond formation protein DsbB